MTNTNGTNVVILGGVRTPIGKLSGIFADIPATTLGSIAVTESLERSHIDPNQVDYTIMGNVLGSGLGQAPARQVSIHAGVPDTSSALTINKMCASGIMSIILGSQMIKAGDIEMAAVGGMENMTRAPHVLLGSREGKRLGDLELVDTMVHDGLWCCFNDRHMGNLAEKTALDFEVTREEQDKFAFLSHQRASMATSEGRFRNEIVPVPVHRRDGTILVENDEGPRASASIANLSQLKEAFPPGLTVTAGNSSQISDGAAALVIGSEMKAKNLDLEPIARIDDYVWVANDTARLFEAPASAVKKLLQRGGMTLSDVDLLEINEAFAAQILANGKVLELDWEKVNVNGGAIALGHPIGASGARVLVTLFHSLKERGLSTGIAALCHAGGGAVAMRISLC